MSLNNIVRAVRKILKMGTDPYQWLREHKEERYFEKLEIDLGVAREIEEFKKFGEGFYVAELNGTCEIILNEKDVDAIPLYRGRKCLSDFWRFFITNTAQAGKTLTLIIYKQGAFDIFDTDYWLNILKDSQDDAKGVLDNIKVSTDKIIADAATAAKQDLLKTVMDAVQVGTDKILADGATGTKQDLLKNVTDNIKNVLDNVQVGTDKIISAAATAAKQDIAKTAIDLVQTAAYDTKTAVNTLAAAAATATKQDLLKTVTDNIKVTMDEVWDEVSGLSAEKLHSNRGFETGDLTGFARDGGGTETVQGGVKKWGNYAVQLEVPDDVASAIYNTDMVEVNEGDIVILSAWMKADAQINSSYIGMYKYGLDGSYQGAANGELQGNNYDWKKVEEEFTIPNGTRKVRIQVMFTNYGATAYGYMDELSLKKKSRMRIVLDSVQVGTDKIVVGGATEAKQDALATAINNVKTGTDKIIASGATEAKQDLIITRLESIGEKTGTSVVPTNDLIHSYDTETTITEEAYTKAYEAKIYLAGKYRVKFDMLSNADGHDIFGRIYLNGVGYGTERVTSSEEYTTYSEDLVFAVDDLLQLYTKIDSDPFYGKFRNIRLYGEYGIVYAVDT